MRLLFFLSFIFSSLYLRAQDDVQKQLQTLDNNLSQRHLYFQKREHKIDVLKEVAKNTESDQGRFKILREICFQFMPYNADSAFYYAQQCHQWAQKIQSEDAKIAADLLMAQTYALLGIYPEALTTSASIRPFIQTETHLKDYFSVQISTYLSLSAFNDPQEIKDRNNHLRMVYQDSLLLYTPPNDVVHQVVEAERLIDKGHMDQSIQLLLQLREQMDTSERNYAFVSYTLAKAFKEKRDQTSAIQYLAESANTDIINGIREYVSLRELAVLLYETGALEKANDYVKISLDDALESNSRIRSYQVLEIIPVISNAYQKMRDTQNQQMLISLWSVGIILVILVMALGYIFKQKNKLETANQEIRSNNVQMQDLNSQLQKNHEQLTLANKQLLSVNQQQEEYIGRYLNLCSHYIGKIDEYRLSLIRRANKGTKEDVLKKLKSKDIVEQELKDFYEDFDQSFLDLFPNFVADFNLLMKEGEEIHPKKDELLNTELRIFALIRLGIKESAQIAKFLRYGVTTIYNYRTKVRNKAKLPKEAFEQAIMDI